MVQLSVPPRVVEEALRGVYCTIFNERLPIRAQRALLTAAAIVQPVVSGVERDEVRLAGRPAIRFLPSDGPPPHPDRADPQDHGPPAILYLHGGGFAVGSPRTHRPLTARLARNARTVVYSLDYRLAPEHPYPAAVDDAEAAFRHLVDHYGHPPDRIAIAGDSAGGGIAAATTARILNSGGAAPGALLLIAPAVDPYIGSQETTDDTVLRRGWVETVCEAYRGDTPPDDPGFAPVHGRVAGFPPTLIQIGGRERMLSPQVHAFADRLRDENVDVTLMESPGLWHVAQVQAGLVRAAAESVDEMAAFLRAGLRRQ